MRVHKRVAVRGFSVRHLFHGDASTLQRGAIHRLACASFSGPGRRFFFSRVFSSNFHISSSLLAGRPFLQDTSDVVHKPLRAVADQSRLIGEENNTGALSSEECPVPFICSLYSEIEQKMPFGPEIPQRSHASVSGSRPPREQNGPEE